MQGYVLVQTLSSIILGSANIALALKKSINKASRRSPHNQGWTKDTPFQAKGVSSPRRYVLLDT